MSGASLSLRGIQQRYPVADAPTLNGVDLDLVPGAVTALLGPSGCGKSTLISIVAGLLRAEGAVHLDGTDVTRLPAERRGVGVVFQRPLLFPHLNVLDNVAFGPRRRGSDTRRARRRAMDLLELVGVAELANRAADAMSGGQAQRVALARALAHEPRLLLLDEPLSALDPETRERTRELIVRIQRELQLTTLFVTHDQQEAIEVSDRIALLIGGRIAQHGTPADVFRRPESLAVAQFLRGVTLLTGTATPGRFEHVNAAIDIPPEAPTGEVHLVVPDHAVLLDRSGGLAVSVTDINDLGHTLRLRLTLPDGTALSTEVLPGTSHPRVGEHTRVHLHTESLWTIPGTRRHA